MDWRFVRSTVLRLLLPLWFGIYAALTLYHVVLRGGLGGDLLIYRFAAETVLSGGNPWTLQPAGYAFAAPPPTLLLYLPVALLPPPFATVLMMSAGLAAATWALRRLELPLWWLLFPPLFGALLIGSPDAILMPLLLVRGRPAGLAAVLKVYALVPLLFQRRWGAIAMAAAVSALSLPLWPMFISNLGFVATALNEGTADLSAWGTWLTLPVLAALFLLRRHGAEWLVVPSLWPKTQGHYGTMSLPAVCRHPLAAAIIGLNTPLMPPIAVLVMAIEVTSRERCALGGSRWTSVKR